MRKKEKNKLKKKEIFFMAPKDEKKIYKKEKLGINDYKIYPVTKMTQADIEKFEKGKGNIHGMSKE